MIIIYQEFSTSIENNIILYILEILININHEMFEGYDQLENHDHVLFKQIYDFKM
jgi:hypothetical protein